MPDVLFHLGKRAETRWNYNIARENRAYHFKNKWRDRKLSEWDDKERRKLVDIYERVLASPKREVYEDHLKHILRGSEWVSPPPTTIRVGRSLWIARSSAFPPFPQH